LAFYIQTVDYDRHFVFVSGDVLYGFLAVWRLAEECMEREPFDSFQTDRFSNKSQQADFLGSGNGDRFALNQI